MGQGPRRGLLGSNQTKLSLSLARGYDLGRVCSQDLALALVGPLARAAIHLVLEPVPGICPSKAAGLIKGAGEKSYESKTSLRGESPHREVAFHHAPHILFMGGRHQVQSTLQGRRPGRVTAELQLHDTHSLKSPGGRW